MKKFIILAVILIVILTFLVVSRKSPLKKCYWDLPHGSYTCDYIWEKDTMKPL